MASVSVIKTTKSENERLYSKFDHNIRSFLKNYDNVTLTGDLISLVMIFLLKVFCKPIT